MADSDPRQLLLLLDGHSLAYRAFYALPVENFSTTTGQPTNAVYGFTSMLINVLRDETPTHIAVAFDVSRQTFRSAEYADYKANRSKSPDEFKGQVSLIKEVLDALRVTTVEREGYEADDVIGTLGHPGPGGRHGRADLLRRPRRLPAGQRPLHRALPHARRLRADPDDARCRVRPSTGSRRSSTPTWPPWWGRAATTCPGVPERRARRPRPSGSTSSARSRRSSPGSTRSPARPATRCGSTWPT